MTNNRFRSFAAGSLALLMLGGLRLLLPLSAFAADEKIDVLAQEIAAAQCDGSKQDWVDALTENAGQSGPDFYIMAIAAQGGCSLSGYANALRKAIAGQTAAVSASAKERSALALIACDENAKIECTEILEANAQSLGIMSRVFGLHLINNGVSSSKITNNVLIGEILDAQCADGGWAVTGNWGDPDVTAMTLQALAPYRSESSVKPAVEAAISFLSEKQLETGAYRSYGTENCESTAQVLIALTALGIDTTTDARFTKSGHTLLDGILQFRVSTGVYAHTADGTASAIATMQTYLALTAAQCSHPLYLYHGAAPQMQQIVSQTTSSQTTSGTKITSTITTASATKLAENISTIKSSSSENETTLYATTTAISTDIETTTAHSNTTEDTMFFYYTSSSTKLSELSTIVLTTKSESNENVEKYRYRFPLILSVTILFFAITLFCVIRKKKSAKTYLTIAFIYGASIAAILLIRIQTPAQYYQTNARSGGKVTMEIRCDVIIGLPGSEEYPQDGVIMQKTEFSIDENENALTLLYDAVKAYQLQIEVDGISGDIVETAYVRGISSLYEFDFGDLSGWTYTVNGERPPVGCGAYTLSDGDEVAWIYTINL